MDTLLYPTLNQACDYLSMLGYHLSTPSTPPHTQRRFSNPGAAVTVWISKSHPIKNHGCNNWTMPHSQLNHISCVWCAACVNVGALFTHQGISTRYALLRFDVGTSQFCPHLTWLYHGNEGSRFVQRRYTWEDNRHNQKVLAKIRRIVPCWARYRNICVSIYVCISRCLSSHLRG